MKQNLKPSYGRKPETFKLIGNSTNELGEIEKKNYRKLKNKPKKCSAVKTICIKCRNYQIHKNSNNYELKICPRCIDKYPSEKSKFNDLLARRAVRLSQKLPKSEKWFFNLDKKYKFLVNSDLSNIPYGYYIPDIINFDFKYIIEIDGSSHNSKKSIEKDAKRDVWFENEGFKVFRIKAYNISSYKKVIKEIIELREKNFPQVKRTRQADKKRNKQVNKFRQLDKMVKDRNTKRKNEKVKTILRKRVSNDKI